MGASIGTIGTARAQYHLRQSFVTLNMYPLNNPEIMIANAASKFDEQGNFRDEAKELIGVLLTRLVEWTRLFRASDNGEQNRLQKAQEQKMAGAPDALLPSLRADPLLLNPGLQYGWRIPVYQQEE